MEETLTEYLCQSPVVLIVFNRPDKTRSLLRILRKVSPSKVYVIADGPRSHIGSDKENVAEVRQIIEQEIDWKCDITKIYSDVNLSGPVRVPSGFDQVFKKEEQVIILEDDCMPSISFFRYCDELLSAYKHDLRVGTICGFNLEFSDLGMSIEGRHDSSYFFSKYPASWGWATWKRVWLQFDHEMNDFPSLVREGFFKSISSIRSVRKFWLRKYKSFYEKKKNNWDYKLTYSLLKNGQLSAIPNHNLVSNVGTDSGANYRAKDYVSRKKSQDLDFPLKHPLHFQADWVYDHRVSTHFFNSSYFSKFMRVIRNFILRFS